MPTASPAADATPWLVPVVVALVAAGAVLIASALAFAGRPAAARRWCPFSDDDLPAFGASPPGSGASTGPRSGTTRASGSRGQPATALGAAGVVALLAAVALAVAVGRTGRPTADDAAPPETAHLTFGGVVLEQRAVGVTVAYPDVTVRVGPGMAGSAHVRLPTFNCLADTPPREPLAAGCVRSLEEFADLTTPELSVVREAAGTLRLSGRFATYVRPNGSPPEYTGRVYALTVTARPRGSSPAGEFRLADGRTTTATGDGLGELRSGG